MATHGSNEGTQSSNRPARPANLRVAATIRMGTLAAGALGMLGLSLGIICGLGASNPVTEILYRSVVMSVCLAVVGGIAGTIAGHIIQEQLIRQAEVMRQLADDRRLAELQARQAEAAETGNADVAKEEKIT